MTDGNFMNETDTDWAILYIHLKVDRKGRSYISDKGGKTWKKNLEGRAETMGDKLLRRLVASGAEVITTPNGEIYTKELDRARITPGNFPERFIRYLRTSPPSLGYSSD